jgi:hypothetical protein
LDIGFLGCVECSTNGDLLGKRRIFVLPSGSADAKASGELEWFNIRASFTLAFEILRLMLPGLPVGFSTFIPPSFPMTLAHALF